MALPGRIYPLVDMPPPTGFTRTDEVVINVSSGITGLMLVAALMAIQGVAVGSAPVCAVRLIV